MANLAAVHIYALIALLLEQHFNDVACQIADAGKGANGSDFDICDNITMDSSWKDQIKIHPCHYSTHTHPRLMQRKRRTLEEREEFHHLAIFNIRYDLDFQEAGGSCSVRLQKEWLYGDEGPQNLTEFSYNRIWYKRMCNFFSYLECIPIKELRTKSKKVLMELAAKKLVTVRSIHEKHRHPGALPDNHFHLPPDVNISKVDPKSIRNNADILDKSLAGTPPNPKYLTHKPLLEYESSNQSTVGLERLTIGGRGPGKGRHKSGPGGSRMDITGLQKRKPLPVEEYLLDGICACSTYDPEYPDRLRPDYGMDFVEDQMRPRWCVAAPGNLCGRVYFRKNLWPGQDFEMSDHIGCPKKYDGDEYECVRWQLVSNKNEDELLKVLPDTMTSTCEKKKEESGF